MVQPTPHPAEHLGESETRNADLDNRGLRCPRRNLWRGAWRCGTRLDHLPPVQKSAAVDDADIPLVESFGLRKEAKQIGVAQGATFSDRGGAISIPMVDPHAKK